MMTKTTKKSGNSNKPNKPKKKLHPALLFVLVVLSIVFTFIIIAGAGLMAYVSNRTFEEARTPNVYADDTASKSTGVMGAVKKMFERVPERTNFLLFGVDDEGGGVRSDTIIMGSFNSKTKSLYLVSVPRDIMVSIPDKDVPEYNAKGIYPPSYMKLNEVLAYIGKDYGIGALMKQLENEFGVKLDYYIKVDTDGFVDIIDALGGVKMTLTRSYNYYDPTQDFRINLSAGTQTLMGKDAEGFVRYRADYAGGDLQRIKVQQQFMGELFKQTLQKDNLIQNAPELMKVILDNTTTNVTIADATKYLQFLPALTSENLIMYSLGAENSVSYRDSRGISYLRLDRDFVDEVINEVFFGIGDEPPENSKELRISVLNGSGVKGLAKETSDELEKLGYNITNIGDFAGRKQEKDRIFVGKTGFGKDLSDIFKNSEIIVDKSNVTNNSDITIVLGTHNDEE